MHPKGVFREAKNVSAGVLLDFDPVVHLVDAQNLRVAAVAAQFVVLAHDEGLDRLGRADFAAQTTEAAARQVEIEVVQNLDLLSRLAVTAERDQIVGARLGALIADDAGLSPGGGLGLQTQDAAEPRRDAVPPGIET